MICTTAPQQGRTAAGARPCSGVLGGYVWNASVEMGMNWAAFGNSAHDATLFTTKRRPARHLGAPPS